MARRVSPHLPGLAATRPRRVRRGLESTLWAMRPTLRRADLATVAMARTLADAIDDEAAAGPAASGQVIAALTRQLAAMVTDLAADRTPADADPHLAALLDDLSPPRLYPAAG